MTFAAEFAELRDSLRDAQIALKGERRARLELEREYATTVLASSHCVEPINESVRNLVADNRHFVGTCDRCGKRAPLKPESHHHRSDSVCAWGCSVEVEP